MSEKILIIQLRQLGDILLTTPILREIKREKPDSHITFLSHKMGERILKDCPYIDELCCYDDSWTFFDNLKLAIKLRREKFDQVFDFLNNPRSAVLTFASGSKKRIAFESKRNFAYSETVKRVSEDTYIVKEKFKLLEHAGYSPEDISLVLPWNKSQTGPLMTVWNEFNGFQSAPIKVLLSPTHRRQVRRWSLEKYAQISDRLVEEWGAATIWLWGPGEEEEINKAISLCKKPTHKAPKTEFGEMAALIANMDLFIGNSNGPSHVAVATDIPSLQLHGHTSAVSWCPLNERHQALQSPEYGKEKIANINLIETSDVWTKLQEMKPTIENNASKTIKPVINW